MYFPRNFSAYTKAISDFSLDQLDSELIRLTEEYFRTPTSEKHEVRRMLNYIRSKLGLPEVNEYELLTTKSRVTSEHVGVQQSDAQEGQNLDFAAHNLEIRK
jgi:hypothetical protein